MTTKTKILNDIRKHCLVCCDGSWVAVRDCTGCIPPGKDHKCKMYPYRFGTDPTPAKGGKNPFSDKEKPIHNYI